MRYILTIVILFNTCFCNLLYAQISQGGIPPGLTIKADKKIPRAILPVMDNMKLLKKYEKQIDTPFKKFTFAELIQLKIRPLENGIWDTVGNGRICRYAIQSEGAFSLNLICSKYHLPPGSKLFVYSKNGEHILGAFTSRNNKQNGRLAISPVYGDEIIIEYVEPLYTTLQAELEIEKIGHGFVDISNTFGNKDQYIENAGACQVNINCPEGAEWQIEKRAVCKIIIEGKEICTGVLLNNTLFDGKPYVLTARHCLVSKDSVQDNIFFFNYESETCKGNTGPEDQTISVARLVSFTKTRKLDFALFELSSFPPKEYKPFYSGWNAASGPPENSVCIHHSKGEPKKISVDYDASVTGDFGEGFDKNSHWKIKKWDIGATEKGSSGAPQFDQDHLITGILSGGPSGGCDGPLIDYFCKFSLAWDKYEEPSEQLKHWLDPTNSGNKQVSGFDPFYSLYQYDAELVDILQPDSLFCSYDQLSPVIKIRNMGTETLTSLKIEYYVSENRRTTLTKSIYLPTFSTQSIVLPGLKVPDGDIQFIINLKEPNGQTDQNKLNNTQVHNFTAAQGNVYELRVKTDNYGYETSWSIRDSAGEMIYSDDALLSNKTSEYNLCLTSGSYTFRIEDSFGDGLCCENGNGSFRLKNSDTDSLILRGDNFNSLLEHDFCVNSKNDRYDIELVNIQGIKNRLCNRNSIHPKAIVRNRGDVSLTELHFRRFLNHDTLELFTWEGLLPGHQSDTIILPSFLPALGDNKFQIEVELVNDSLEKNTSNNTKNKQFIVSPGHSLQLTLQTDLFASETTWTLTEESGELIDEGGPYRDNMMHIITEDFCLDVDKCYSFDLYDSVGDGICCGWSGDGDHLLVNLSTGDTLSKGGEFKEKIHSGFCLSTAHRNDTTVDSLKIYPNPVYRKAFIKTTENSHLKTEVYDMFGKLVLVKESNSYLTEIDFGNLKEGIYFVKLTVNEKFRRTKKLILLKEQNK